MTPPSHSFDEHRGEVLLRLEAPTFGELLAEGARALAELLSEEPSGPLQDTEHVALTAADPSTLLVDWLNELIFRSETRHRIYWDVRIIEATKKRLVAEIRGRPATRLRTQVKAATFHRLKVTVAPTICQAQVILDV